MKYGYNGGCLGKTTWLIIITLKTDYVLMMFTEIGFMYSFYIFYSQAKLDKY